jgi:FKBP-type peptidyl-prolyl cis-trans isomerase FkpA
MAETKLRDRAFALSLAILFAFTALATSVAVILSIISSNKATKKADAGSSTTTSQSQKCTTSCLAGKPLAGFTPISSVPTLKIIDTKVGTGAAATASSTVSVLYTGAVASTGIVFQSSLDNGPQPVTFPLTNVIEGWQKGIPGMKVGGVRQLLIPASLAYGANPPSGSGIPPNAALVFNITLLNVK